MRELATADTTARFFVIAAAMVVTLVAFGVVHDQVTVRLSPAYFVLAHPKVFPFTSPTLVALGWGVFAGGSAGLPAGFLLAAAATNGRKHPPLSPRELAAPVATWIATMSTIAILAGLLGYTLGSLGQIHLGGMLAETVPLSEQSRFLGVRWAHAGTYLSGLAGAVLLLLRASRIRRLRSTGSVWATNL
jgi:hypothetical protein